MIKPVASLDSSQFPGFQFGVQISKPIGHLGLSDRPNEKFVSREKSLRRSRVRSVTEISRRVTGISWGVQMAWAIATYLPDLT